MGELVEEKIANECTGDYVLAVNDTMNVLSGKWKIPVIAVLLYGKRRFGELERAIPKINPRMLSKELRDLENNGIVKRTVFDSIPVTVEYELTATGYSFRKVLNIMLEWGLEHRQSFLDKS